MGDFIWAMAVSFQTLFIILSGVIYVYTREKSFKYYGLYNVFLIIYLLSRYDPVYDAFEGFVGNWLARRNARIFTNILFFYVQVLFYNFYTIFALYFLDFDKHIKKYFKGVVQILRALFFFFLIFGVFCFFIKDEDLYISFYTFLYLPVMLSIFVPTVIRAIKYSGKHKNYFLIGVTTFVAFALVAFVGSFVPSLNMENPIAFFFLGIVIETLFFSLGLAYKVKILNDDKNRVYNEITRHKHQQQVSKLQGLLEGEEAERKRLAQELHDGIAGDLTAMRYQLSFIDMQKETPENADVIKELAQIVERSSVQIREISHNLSPSSITNFGLIKALENYCMKIEKHSPLKIHFHVEGESPDISERYETHIYRIVQELMNNIIKHSGATDAFLEINFEDPILTINVKDNGKGFLFDENTDGIGFSNINSRIKFLNASFKKEKTDTGSSFIIKVNTNYIKQN